MLGWIVAGAGGGCLANTAIAVLIVTRRRALSAQYSAAIPALSSAASAQRADW